MMSVAYIICPILRSKGEAHFQKKGAWKQRTITVHCGHSLPMWPWATYMNFLCPASSSSKWIIMPPCKIGLMFSEVMHVKRLTQWLTFSKCSRNIALTVTKSGGLAARPSKANKEARLVEKKVSFISEAGNLWGRADSVQRLTPPPPTDNQWTRAFKGEFQGCTSRERGLQAETAQTALTVILKLVMQWSDQRHLDCFKYN